MKKDVLNKIPALKNNDGKLSGGFSALSFEQIAKIKGGKNTKNCVNSGNCTQGTHTDCTNSGQCFSDISLESL
jgi:hypothetical protein